MDSFGGQASTGQTVGGDFSFSVGNTALIWLPVMHSGPSPTAGKDEYVATFPVRLRLNPNTPIRVEIWRNAIDNAYPFPPDSSPYQEHLTLIGYLE